MRAASWFSPASSIRTCISICRSWRPSPRTRTRPEAWRRWSAALLRSSRCAALRATTMRLEGYQLWKSKAEGHSACDYTFHMSVTKYEDKTEGQLREIVRGRHRIVQDFSRVQEFFWGRRWRDVPDPGAGQETRRDRDRALRERRTREPAAGEPAGAREDRPGVARAEPAGIGGGRRYGPLRDVSREHGRGGIRGSPFLRTCTRGSHGGEGAGCEDFDRVRAAALSSG